MTLAADYYRRPSDAELAFRAEERILAAALAARRCGPGSQVALMLGLVEREEVTA